MPGDHHQPFSAVSGAVLSSLRSRHPSSNKGRSKDSPWVACKMRPRPPSALERMLPRRPHRWQPWLNSVASHGPVPI
eukprot:scaffold870_cov268-Pinguiococcus_pyrenoidosus.AAC.53